MKYKHVYWLKIDLSNETKSGIEWENLKKYKEKYDCNMEVYYYSNNPFTKKVIKLECNQAYQELDLDVNSLNDGSLIRVMNRPKNIELYNKPIEVFFEMYIKSIVENIPNISFDGVLNIEDLKNKILNKETLEFDGELVTFNKDVSNPFLNIALVEIDKKFYLESYLYDNKTEEIEYLESNFINLNIINTEEKLKLKMNNEFDEINKKYIVFIDEFIERVNKIQENSKEEELCEE